ncbi:dirigent protein 19-like protein [Tanacetum coccineum]
MENQSDYRVLDLKLYVSCGVHSLRKQDVHIHMLVEMRYPLTAPTIIDMLNRKLQANHWNEMCYQLPKLLTKQHKELMIVGIKILHDDLEVTVAKMWWWWRGSAAEGGGGVERGDGSGRKKVKMVDQGRSGPVERVLVVGCGWPEAAPVAGKYGEGECDPLTLKPNTTSKVVGTAEGTSITSGLDGLQSISIAKLTLDVKKHKGSISIVGGTHNIKPSNHPVVGGTDDFLFVQGYVTSSPVNLAGITVTYKIEFHLYWPPYASSKL